MLCAVHAANNLLQVKAFTREAFESISEELELETGCGIPALRLPWRCNGSPFRNMWGLGNYSADVLVTALQRFDPALSVQCFYGRGASEVNEQLDNRAALAEAFADLGDSILGFICNVKISQGFGLLNLSHWYTICRYEPRDVGVTTAPVAWYLLDSRIGTPHPIEDLASGVRGHIFGLLNEGGSVIMVSGSRLDYEHPASGTSAEDPWPWFGDTSLLAWSLL